MDRGSCYSLLESWSVIEPGDPPQVAQSSSGCENLAEVDALPIKILQCAIEPGVPPKPPLLGWELQ